MLSGFKTYIFSGLVVLFSLFLAFGWISVETFEVLMGVFGGASMFALRVGIKKTK
jgi:hypothetical protein